MTTVADVAQTVQTVFTTTADELARYTGFVQRPSKLTGAAFAQALVFGWLADPPATVEAPAAAAAVAVAGVAITPPGLDPRCGEAGAVVLEQLLAAATRAIVAAADPVALPLRERFTAVQVRDRSALTRPAALAPWWPGCGGGPGRHRRRAHGACQPRSVPRDAAGTAADGWAHPRPADAAGGRTAHPRRLAPGRPGLLRPAHLCPDRRPGRLRALPPACLAHGV